MITHSHASIIDVGEKWLRNTMKCGIVAKELVTTTKEQADVIGFKNGWSFLLEAKVSRADFLQDKHKSFRQNPEQGMGDFRFYIVPEGLIKTEELPDNWGLLEVNDKNKVSSVYNPHGGGNIHSTWKAHPKCLACENYAMYTLLLRYKGEIKRMGSNQRIIT